jgi:hypothetical protein
VAISFVIIDTTISHLACWRKGALQCRALLAKIGPKGARPLRGSQSIVFNENDYFM